MSVAFNERERIQGAPLSFVSAKREKWAGGEKRERGRNTSLWVIGPNSAIEAGFILDVA